MNVTKIMNGDTVIVSPVFSGGCEPSYWELSINDRLIWRTFESPKEAFQYVESLYRRRSQDMRPQGYLPLS